MSAYIGTRRIAPVCVCTCNFGHTCAYNVVCTYDFEHIRAYTRGFGTHTHTYSNTFPHKTGAHEIIDGEFCRARDPGDTLVVKNQEEYALQTSESCVVTVRLYIDTYIQNMCVYVCVYIYALQASEFCVVTVRFYIHTCIHTYIQIMCVFVCV